MTTFRCDALSLMDRLRPLFVDPKFQDLEIFCRNGEIVRTSKLLFSTFLPRSYQKELAKIDKTIGDSMTCLILPENSAKEISGLISDSLGIGVNRNLSTDIDEYFADRYYFADFNKFKQGNLNSFVAISDKLAEEVTKISRKPRSKNRKADPEVCSSNEVREEAVGPEDDAVEEEEEEDREWQNVGEESFDQNPFQDEENEDEDEDQEMEEGSDQEDVDDDQDEWNDDLDADKKLKKRKMTDNDQTEKKKKRIAAVYADFAEWNYKTKRGKCKVCEEEFDKDPRRLQRHVERTHLGNYNKRKYERKMLLHELIKTEHGETGESDHPDNDSKIAEEKTINEASAELRAIKDDGKRKKIQERLDELTASGYKLGKTGRLYKKEQCAICGKTLCSKYALKKHEDAVHFNIRPFGCDICPKRFIMKNDLRDHITAVHKKIKSCVCDVCGLKLATQHGLRVHKLVHQEGTKCIKCFKCDKMFRHMCTYRRHVERMHDFTPDKRLKCDECGKFFNHREGLATHVKKFHTPQAVVYKCHICSSAFAYKYERTKHLRRFHKMDKRMALAISADDVPPEVAATCFGDLGAVDDNDDDSPDDDDSNDELTVDKNEQKVSTEISGNKKPKTAIRGSSVLHHLPSTQSLSQPTIGEDNTVGDDNLLKYRQQQVQHPHQAFSSLLASHAQQQVAAVAAAAQHHNQPHHAAAAIMVDQASAAHLQMAMGTLTGGHGFNHALHFQRHNH